MNEGIFTSPKRLVRGAAWLAMLALVGCQNTDIPSAPSTGGQLAPTEASRTIIGATTTYIIAPSPAGEPQDLLGDARGLNELGQASGSVRAAGDFKAYRWTAGSGLTVLSGCCATMHGSDINDLGVVVGTSSGGPAGATRGFVATGNTMTTLSILPGADWFDDARAVAINDAGQIVGSSATSTSSKHAVLWSAAGVIQDLGTLGGTNSAAIDINELGQVIGSSQIAGNVATHFFLWSTGTGIQDLNALLGPITSVVEINDAGQIIGTYTAPSGDSHAFLYTPGSGLLDLGTLGGTTSTPTGLNNNGQVVGTSTLSDGTTHAFLWTPTDGMEDITAINPGITEVRRLNDNLQTLTGTMQPDARPGYTTSLMLSQLVQLAFTPAGNGGGGDAAPVAAFTWSCQKKKCSFDASSSTDDNGIVSYAWDLDRHNGNGRNHGVKTHTTYPKGGTHDVVLTVTDTKGQTSSVTHTVTLP